MDGNVAYGGFLLFVVLGGFLTFVIICGALMARGYNSLARHERDKSIERNLREELKDQAAERRAARKILGERQ